MTAQWLEHLSTEGRHEYVDTEQRGLRLCVRNGRMTWSVRYLGETGHVRFTLGEFPALGLAAARKEALKAQGAKAAGADPQLVRQVARKAAREAVRRRRLGETVKGALGSWLKDSKAGPGSRWKGGLEGGSARSFLPHVNRLARDLGDVVLTELEPRDLERFVGAPDAANTRNHALTMLRGFLTWARKRGLLQRAMATALVEDIEREKTAARTRVLTDDELRALVYGFGPTRYGRAVRLLALTACRRDEVLGMEWAWFDADKAVLTIPPSAEKSGAQRGEARALPLSKTAVALLAEQRAALFAEGTRSDYVFANGDGDRPRPDVLQPILNRLRGLRANGKPRTAEKSGGALPLDVTVHDVRRTVADVMRSRLGVSPWIVDHGVLGHTRPKMLRTYAPTLPTEEARPAMEAWSAELARILDAKAEKRSKA